MSATGAGEAFIRAVYGHEVHARMLLAGQSLADAAAGALNAVRQVGGLGGAICVSAHSEIEMPFTDGYVSRALEHRRAAGSQRDKLIGIARCSPGGQYPASSDRIS